MFPYLYLQMTDIAAVFSAKPSGPYDKGLVVKVLQVGEEITYKGKDGTVQSWSL
jgi:hypothetical protein